MMAFDPNDHMTNLSGKKYLEIKWRIVWFREVWPNGTIHVEHIHLDETSAIFRATVTMIGDDGVSHGWATDYGSETKGDFKDFIEKGAAKAIGRALAGCGYGTAFAEDYDEGGSVADSPVERPNRQEAPAATEQRPAPPVPTQRATEASTTDAPAVPVDLGALHGDLKNKGFTDDEVHPLAHDLGCAWFGIASLKELTPKSLSHFRRKLAPLTHDQIAEAWSAANDAKRIGPNDGQLAGMPPSSNTAQYARLGE
jgi:hypothetical protein